MTSITNLSLLIVEDYQLLSDAWAVFFRAKTSFNVIGTASNQAAAWQLVNNSHPDIILLDINLGEVSGLDLIPVFLKESPQSRIIIVTVSAFPWLAKKAMKAGARGYLTKNEDFEVMLDAIKIIAGGGVFISAGAIEPELDPVAIIKPKEGLSKKENEIMRYVCEGLNTKDIAKKIKLSVRTIETHRHSIMKKLEMKNVIELTNFYLKNFSN